MGQGVENMAEWKLLKEITLEESQNIAFELTDIECKEFYIFANVGITESGNTSIDINGGEASFFTNIWTVGDKKYNTTHAFMVGNRFVAEETVDYKLQGYAQQNIQGTHPGAGISGTKITSIRLFRNASSNTFLEGSTFEIWGR